jgi:hypothetical protein
MRIFRSIACPPARGNLRAAGFSYLASGVAFLGVAFLAGQAAFTGVGFTFVGLGIAFIVRGRNER